jgi:hypothetical protein
MQSWVPHVRRKTVIRPRGLLTVRLHQDERVGSLRSEEIRDGVCEFAKSIWPDQHGSFGVDPSRLAIIGAVFSCGPLTDF